MAIRCTPYGVLVTSAQVEEHTKLKLHDASIEFEYFQRTFETKEEIFDTYQKIFDAKKENGRIIEGLVLRNVSGKFSMKLMNLDYDSTK